eukprot:2442227-Pyramimonas_sp.AAC.1
MVHAARQQGFWLGLCVPPGGSHRGRGLARVFVHKKAVPQAENVRGGGGLERRAAELPIALLRPPRRNGGGVAHLTNSLLFGHVCGGVNLLGQLLNVHLEALLRNEIPTRATVSPRIVKWMDGRKDGWMDGWMNNVGPFGCVAVGAPSAESASHAASGRKRLVLDSNSSRRRAKANVSGRGWLRAARICPGGGVP